ncbi:MAG: hypothetical protein EA424_13695 [Planctomycetaceae bacterium]|jgi:hypothetical protein|nr:MAG: hypothetical protein EA424_13695 [Planctomycetaceae bacterium]
MATVGQSALYDDLLDLLSEGVDPGRLRRFRLSEAKQIRLDWLLERNREGTLTEEESAELDDFERFEHLVRMLKARALGQSEE